MRSIRGPIVMARDPFAAGDVVWAPDPYNHGADPRPWVVLVADALPYAGEEYVCAGLTLSDLEENLRVPASAWDTGDPDRTSYCSPWVLATVKHDRIADPQGRLTDAFTERIVSTAVAYLTGDVQPDL